MKHKLVIEIITESYEEEQYILMKFPESWWYSANPREGYTVFYLPAANEEKVQEAITEWKEMKRK
jgi:hypothetical protein